MDPSAFANITRQPSSASRGAGGLASAEQLPLILAAKAGDIGARNALVSSNMGLIIMAIRRTGADPAEFLVEGFMGFLAALRDFDPSRGTQLSTLAVTTIWWKVVNAFRQERRYRSRGRNGELTEFLAANLKAADAPRRHSTESGEAAAKLRLCVEKLPRRLQGVVSSRMGGATLQQIADAIGVSKERVRQLESRAHYELRSMLEQMGVSAA